MTDTDIPLFPYTIMTITLIIVGIIMKKIKVQAVVYTVETPYQNKLQLKVIAVARDHSHANC